MDAMFEHPVDVRWRDVDALGHVNHAVFLTYLEEGRDAFFKQTFGGEPDYVVARVEVDLRAEVRYPQRYAWPWNAWARRASPPARRS
jgi:acyl-CoA thioester hydrolase